MVSTQEKHMGALYTTGPMLGECQEDPGTHTVSAATGEGRRRGFRQGSKECWFPSSSRPDHRVSSLPLPFIRPLHLHRQQRFTSSLPITFLLTDLHQSLLCIISFYCASSIFIEYRQFLLGIINLCCASSIFTEHHQLYLCIINVYSITSTFTAHLTILHESSSLDSSCYHFYTSTCMVSVSLPIPLKRWP